MYIFTRKESLMSSHDDEHNCPNESTFVGNTSFCLLAVKGAYPTVRSHGVVVRHVWSFWLLQEQKKVLRRAEWTKHCIAGSAGEGDRGGAEWGK